MKCEIIRDLLPNYVDHLTSRESGEEIEQHLRNCEACREIYIKMSAGELEETDTAEISEDLEILKDFRKKRKVTIFSALGIAAAAVLVIWLVFFRWICVPYDLVKPEVSVLETSGETESGLPVGEIREDSAGGICLVMDQGSLIYLWPQVKIREVTVDGEPEVIAFAVSRTRPWDFWGGRQDFSGNEDDRCEVTFVSDSQRRIQGYPVSELDAVYYLDRGLILTEKGGNDALLKLMEKYGHLVWSWEEEGEC